MNGLCDIKIIIYLHDTTAAYEIIIMYKSSNVASVRLNSIIISIITVERKRRTHTHTIYNNNNNNNIILTYLYDLPIAAAVVPLARVTCLSTQFKHFVHFSV